MPRRLNLDLRSNDSPRIANPRDRMGENDELYAEIRKAGERLIRARRKGWITATQEHLHIEVELDEPEKYRETSKLL